MGDGRRMRMGTDKDQTTKGGKRRWQKRPAQGQQEELNWGTTTPSPVQSR